MFRRENEFDPIVFQYAASYGVPPWVVKATIAKESSFDPSAYRGEPKIGDASRGLMQVLEKTARGLGYKGATGNDTTKTGGLYEPTLSIQLGTKLLGQLRARYPLEPWDAIYAAYNSGAVRRTNGVLVNEPHVSGWRVYASYFNPGWQGPGAGGSGFQPAPPSREPGPR
jgi:soluble lytic murein transglycosylase-like protein